MGYDNNSDEEVMITMKKHIIWCHDIDGLKKYNRNQSTATIAAKNLRQYLHSRMRREKKRKEKEEELGKYSKGRKGGVRNVKTSAEDSTMAVNNHFLFAVVPEWPMAVHHLPVAGCQGLQDII